jgi:hypothetical protein
MVQHQLIWCRDRKQHQFWLKFVDSVPSFWQAKAQNGIGLAQIDHQETVPHHNIIHKTKIDDMKWFSIN